MPNIIIENLAKLNIGRQEMIKNGFSGQKFDDVQRGKSSYKLDDVILISNKFQISLDYLIYGKERTAGIQFISKDLSNEESRLLGYFALLTDIEKGEVLGELKEKTRDRAEAEEENGAATA